MRSTTMRLALSPFARLRPKENKSGDLVEVRDREKQAVKEDKAKYHPWAVDEKKGLETNPIKEMMREKNAVSTSAVESHPLLKMARMKKAGKKEAAHLAITPEQAKRVVENMYDWSQREWYYKWAAWSLFAFAGMTAYGLSYDRQELHILDSKEEYLSNLSDELKRAKEQSWERRRRALAMAQEFAKHTPAPTKEELQGLKEALSKHIQQDVVPVTQVWERELEEIKAREEEKRRAYERTAKVKGKRYSSVKVLPDGAPEDVDKLMTVEYMLQQPSSEELRKLDEKRRREEQVATTNDELTKFCEAMEAVGKAGKSA